jgi:hypothetical protein
MTHKTNPAIAEPVPLPVVPDLFKPIALNIMPTIDSANATYWIIGNQPKMIPKIPRMIATIPIVSS